MTHNTTSEFLNDILSPRVLWVTSCFDHIWEITFLTYGTQSKIFIYAALVHIHVSDLYLLSCIWTVEYNSVWFLDDRALQHFFQNWGQPLRSTCQNASERNAELQSLLINMTVPCMAVCCEWFWCDWMKEQYQCCLFSPETETKNAI